MPETGCEISYPESADYEAASYRVGGENVDFQIFAKFLVRFSEVTKRPKFGVRQNLRITRFKRKCFRPNPTAS